MARRNSRGFFTNNNNDPEHYVQIITSNRIKLIDCLMAAMLFFS